MTKQPLRVAVDATPLLGPRTGVGAVVDQLLNEMSVDPSLSLTGFIVSWTGRAHLPSVLPSNVIPRAFLCPARGAQRMWRRMDYPRITGFDLVHGTNFVVPPAGGGPELVTIHDFTAWRFPEIVNASSQAYPELVARAIKRGAHVHCVSNFVANEAAEYLSIDPERIHTVVNGFDPTPFAATSALSSPGETKSGSTSKPDSPLGNPVTDGMPYVLAIGTEEPRKGYPTLVEAMEVVWKQNGDVRLIIAGPPGWGSSSIDVAVARSSRPGLIERRGYVSDAERNTLLSGARVLAYPSRYEGFGIPLLEAMAAAIPVVSTKAGSIPEVAGGAASLVLADDSDALGTELSRIVDDERVRDQLVAAGLDRCQQFPWGEASQQMAATYRQVVAA